MTTYFIPTDDNFVEQIAKSIARDRLIAEAVEDIADIDDTDDWLESAFEELWTGTDENDAQQRKAYKSDALAAIRAINLKLLTLSNEG